VHGVQGVLAVGEAGVLLRKTGRARIDVVAEPVRLLPVRAQRIEFRPPDRDRIVAVQGVRIAVLSGLGVPPCGP
jgi:hypothetical protein